MKRNSGITLIALVITIIVLLILAGVAIATMDLETYFLTNNLKYKCSNGFVTGFELGEKVKVFEDVISPEGYKVELRYERGKGDNIKIEESEKENMPIATGMAIQKDGQILARTILFGDIDGDGEIKSGDGNYIQAYLSGGVAPDFAIAAMDVNHDNYICGRAKKNDESTTDNYYQLEDGTVVMSDSEIIHEIMFNQKDIKQDQYASNFKQLKDLGARDDVKEFLETSLPDEFKKSQFKLEANYYEKDKPLECYLKGVKSTTTVKEILDVLPGIDAVIIGNEEYTENSVIKENSVLIISIEGKYDTSSIWFYIEI